MTVLTLLVQYRYRRVPTLALLPIVHFFIGIQFCGYKYIEYGFGSRILAQFESGSMFMLLSFFLIELFMKKIP